MQKAKRGGSFTHNTLYDTSPESRLWRHVIIRSALDSAFGKPDHKLKIIDWVQDSDNTGDFDTVCHYAATNADFIADSLFDILSSPKAAAIVKAEKLKAAILAKDGEDIPADIQTTRFGGF